jgi:hypothetical protein
VSAAVLTTDAPFASDVEWKVGNLLALSRRPMSLIGRPKTQLATASKPQIEISAPGSQTDSARLVGCELQ